MLSPECVSLVYPPRTIMPNTPAAVKKSHPPTNLYFPYFTRLVEYEKLLLQGMNGRLQPLNMDFFARVLINIINNNNHRAIPLSRRSVDMAKVYRIALKISMIAKYVFPVKRDNTNGIDLIKYINCSIKILMHEFQQKQFDEINIERSQEIPDAMANIYHIPSEISIGIQKRQSRGNGLKKHTTFFIRGLDRKGQVSVWRRFNQFYQMRQAMVRVWPGCLIPSLPSKNPLVKNQEEINKKRERYLDDFLKKMAQREYLYYSDEFQTFLRSDMINVSELFQKWAEPSALSIINKYKSTFSILNGRQISTKTVTEIFDFSKMLQTNNEKLVNYRKIVKELALHKDRMNIFYRRYLNVIKSYQQGIMPEYLTSNPQKLLSPTLTPQLSQQIAIIEDLTSRNPYWLLYDMIKNEERDGRAFIEVLYTIEYYGDKARQCHDKIESNFKGIGDASAGRSNIKSLLTKSTNEEIKYQLQVENEDLKKEKEQSQMVRDIVIALVAFVEVEQYKIAKRQYYLNSLQRLAIIQNNSSEGLKSVWNEVLVGLQNIGKSYYS